MRLLRRLISGTLIYILAVGVAPTVSAAGGRQHAVGTRLLSGTSPVQVCIAVDEEQRRLIKSRKTRLVLVLREYNPPKSGEQSLSVTAPDGREQVLGVFPSLAFGPEETEFHKRFLLAPPRLTSVDPNAPICIRARLLANDDSGSARLELETLTPTNNNWPVPH